MLFINIIIVIVVVYLQVEAVILPWKNERLNIAIVIFIVPFVVNVS